MISILKEIFIEYWLKYVNLLLLVISLGVGIFLYNFQPFHEFLHNLKDFEYFGAFVAGIMYVSTVTAATSVVILLVLAQDLNNLGVALVAGLGALIGDYLIFRFVKNNLRNELIYLINEIQDGVGRKRLRGIKQIFRTKYFNWMMPLTAMIMIGSPFPDEIAWGFLGTTKIKTYQVILLSFVLNSAGILLILASSKFLKP